VSLSGFDCVRHQHGDRKRSDAAGDWCVCTGNFGDLDRMNVTDQFSRRFRSEDRHFLFGREAIHADVDHRSSRLYEIAGDHRGSTDRRDEDVGATAFSGEVARF
jgi:hypothetical protein